MRRPTAYLRRLLRQVSIHHPIVPATERNASSPQRTSWDWRSRSRQSASSTSRRTYPTAVTVMSHRLVIEAPRAPALLWEARFLTHRQGITPCRAATASHLRGCRHALEP